MQCSGALRQLWSVTLAFMSSQQNWSQTRGILAHSWALGWSVQNALGASTLSPTPIWCVNLA